MRFVQGALAACDAAAVAAAEGEVCSMADDDEVVAAAAGGAACSEAARREAASLRRQAVARARAGERMRAAARRRLRKDHEDLAEAAAEASSGDEAPVAAVQVLRESAATQVEEDPGQGAEQDEGQGLGDVDCRCDSGGVLLRRTFAGDDPEGRLEELIKLADTILKSECADIARYYGCEEALEGRDRCLASCWEPPDLRLRRPRKAKQAASLRSARLEDRLEHRPELAKRLRLPEAPSRWELLLSRLLRREGCWTRPAPGGAGQGRRRSEAPVRAVLRARERAAHECEKPKGKGALARLQRHREEHRRIAEAAEGPRRSRRTRPSGAAARRAREEKRLRSSTELRAAEAMSNVRSNARKQHEREMPQLRERVLRLGLTSDHLATTLDWIASSAPIIIQVALEEIGAKLAADTHYRNQFETQTSHGTLNNNARSGWEENLFGKAYDGALPFQRCKYGVLNVTNDINGVVGARQYGWSYLELKGGVRDRTTCTARDSAGAAMDEVGTLDCYAHVLSKFSDANLKEVVEVGSGQVFSHPSGWTKPYKEVQIHGPVCLGRDVERIVVHRGRNSEEKDRAMLQRLSAACGGAPVEWISD